MWHWGLRAASPLDKANARRVIEYKQKSKEANLLCFKILDKTLEITHHSAIKSKEYDLESKDNKNDLIVLRLFARFHMADK